MLSGTWNFGMASLSVRTHRPKMDWTKLCGSPDWQNDRNPTRILPLCALQTHQALVIHIFRTSELFHGTTPGQSVYQKHVYPMYRSVKVLIEWLIAPSQKQDEGGIRLKSSIKF